MLSRETGKCPRWNGENVAKRQKGGDPAQGGGTRSVSDEFRKGGILRMQIFNGEQKKWKDLKTFPHTLRVKE